MTFDKIKEIIVDQLGVDEEDVTMETTFENDLDADSLDVFQVINEIEDEFDIEIDTDQTLATVGELVDYVETLID